MRTNQMFRFFTLGSALVLLGAATAEARWPHAPRLSRAESPVQKGLQSVIYDSTVSDPAGDTFGTGAVQPDLERLTAEVEGDELVIHMYFFNDVSAPDSGRIDAIDGFVDLDLDQDGSTGDVPWTDLLRLDGGETEMGNEAYVDLFSYDYNGNVELIDDTDDEVLGLVPLTFGQQSAQVRIPVALLGGDRTVNVAVILGTFAEATDVAPNEGALSTLDGTETVLLQDDRFQVDITWSDFMGGSGSGQLAALSDDSAIFYFFQPDNWESLIKVLDGCAFNNHYWVFFAAATNVEFEVTVTDTVTGTVRTYTNPLGQTAETITDTSAFATCP